MAGSSKDRQKAKFRGIEQDADGNVIYTGQLHSSLKELRDIWESPR